MRDVMALSGLRRLVLHARDQLAATATEPQWKYGNEAWNPGQVKGWAAAELARHVLTLVADCLPASDGITADEARELRERIEALEVIRSSRESELRAVRDSLKQAREEKRNAEREIEEWSSSYEILDEAVRSRLGIPGDDEEASIETYEQKLDELIAASAIQKQADSGPE
jgi:hypothetical protein